MQRTAKGVVVRPSSPHTGDHFILRYVQLNESMGHPGGHIQKEVRNMWQVKLKEQWLKGNKGTSRKPYVPYVLELFPATDSAGALHIKDAP